MGQVSHNNPSHRLTVLHAPPLIEMAQKLRAHIARGTRGKTARVAVGLSETLDGLFHSQTR